MPDTYVVTTPATTVTLAPAPRVGQVAFTVSNIAGRPMRTRLRLIPQEPAQAGWFTVQGGEERLLGLGATETFAVSVAVPPEVPAGSYTFRADAVGEDSPDEDFQAGPTVSLTVPAAVAKPSFPWWIVAVAAAVIVIGVAVFVFISRSGDDPGPVLTDDPVALLAVPDVIGASRDTAQAALESAGFVADVVTIADAAVATTCDPEVLLSVPGATTEIPAGSTVTIAVRPVPKNCFVIVFPTFPNLQLFTDQFTFKDFSS